MLDNIALKVLSVLGGFLFIFHFIKGIKNKVVAGFIVGTPIAYNKTPKIYWLIMIVYFLGAIFLSVVAVKLVLFG